MIAVDSDPLAQAEALAPQGTVAWLLILGSVLLFAASGGATLTSALLLYSPTKLAKRLKNGAREAITREMQEREHHYQVVARAVTLFGVAGALLCFAYGSPDGASRTWIVAGCGVAILLGCVAVPYAIAEPRAERILLQTLPVLRVASRALHYPLVAPTLGVAGLIRRVLRVRDKPESRDELADDILAAVTDSSATSALAEEEKTWIGNIVELQDLQVSEAMTPRTDLISCSDATAVRDALALAVEHGFSRFPIYGKNVDDITGVFYAKDALHLLSQLTESGQPGPSPQDAKQEPVKDRANANGAPRSPRKEAAAILRSNRRKVRATDPVSQLKRTPLFVPETMGLVQLLKQFRSTRTQLAIVLDEYGGTAGLISVEDILEEIVGDIADEYDVQEEEELVTVIEAGRSIDVSARTRVEAVNEHLTTDLPEDGDWDTLAGYVFSELGRIPVAGEEFTLHGVDFKVARADNRRIDRLLLTRVADEASL